MCDDVIKTPREARKVILEIMLEIDVMLFGRPSTKPIIYDQPGSLAREAMDGDVLHFSRPPKNIVRRIINIAIHEVYSLIKNFWQNIISGIGDKEFNSMCQHLSKMLCAIFNPQKSNKHILGYLMKYSQRLDLEEEFKYSHYGDEYVRRVFIYKSFASYVTHKNFIFSL